MMKFLSLTLLLLIHFHSNAQFTIYNPTNTGEPVQKITSLGILNSGKVYAGTLSSGLVEYDGTSWTTYNISTDDNFPNNYITSIFINNSDVWFSTQYNGIGRKSPTSWASYNTSNSSLPNDETWGVGVDLEGNLLIPTFSGFAIDSVSKSKWVIYDQNNTSTLPTESFYNVFYESEDKIWAGTQGYGLAKLSKKTWQFFDKSNSPIADNTINVIKKGPDGNIWIGTNAGVSVYNGTTWTTHNVTSTGGKLPGNRIQTFAMDNENRVVYVGTNSGIGIYKIDSQKWSTKNSINTNLPENNITAIAIDPVTKELWVGMANWGLAVTSDPLTSVSDEKLFSTFLAYPNPTKDILNLSFSTKTSSELHFSITDYMGRKIKDLGKYTVTPGDHTISENLTGITEGCYLLIIESEDTKMVEKIRIH